MLIDKDSVIIDNVKMAQYLKQAEIQFPKGWGDDTGRNTLSGDFSGTFKGIYPKLILTFRRLTQYEIELLCNIFDSPEQTTTYYDPKKKGLYTMQTYSNDWGIVSKRMKRFEGINVSFVARKKRDV